MKNTSGNTDNNNYVFVSYAHKDSAIVLPIIRAMQEAGIALWYDEGIEVGTEWPEYIAKHLIKSRRVICMLSDHFVASNNCRQELTLANGEKKEILAIHLFDNVAMTDGMKLQSGISQAMFFSRSASREDFLDRLITSRFLADCRTGVPAEPPIQRPEPEGSDQEDMEAEIQRRVEETLRRQAEEEAKRKREEEIKRRVEEELNRRAEARRKAEEEKQRIWKNFTDSFDYETSSNGDVTVKGVKDRNHCPETVILPDSVTSIGAGAFDGCTGLTGTPSPTA